MTLIQKALYNIPDLSGIFYTRNSKVIEIVVEIKTEGYMIIANYLDHVFNLLDIVINGFCWIVIQPEPSGFRLIHF